MEEYTIISWESRDIRLFYHPRRWDHIDYVTIESLDGLPLPVSDTGTYCHYFGPVEPLLSVEQVSEMIIEWLNREAQSKAWKTYIEQSRQLSLF